MGRSIPEWPFLCQGCGNWTGPVVEVAGGAISRLTCPTRVNADDTRALGHEEGQATEQVRPAQPEAETI